MDRRQFLGTTAGGLTLGFALDGFGPMREAHAAPRRPSVNTWLSVGTDNSITLTVGASDMGQGSFQGLAPGAGRGPDGRLQPASRWRRAGPRMAAPAPVGAAIATVGSSVTRNNYWRLRDAGAIARETLVQAAMNRAGDGARSNYVVSQRRHRAPALGARLTYGEVAADAALLTPPASAPLVPDAQLKRHRPVAAALGHPVQGRRQREVRPRHAPAEHGVRGDQALPDLRRHAGGDAGRAGRRDGGGAGQRGRRAPGAAPNVAGNVNAVAVVAATTWDAMQAARRLSAEVERCRPTRRR